MYNEYDHRLLLSQLDLSPILTLHHVNDTYKNDVNIDVPISRKFLLTNTLWPRTKHRNWLKAK